MSSRVYKKAKRRVKLKKIFYYHLAIYLIFSTFLFSMNMIDSPRDIWFPYPMTAWFVPLSLHYLFTFGVPFINLDDKWEEQQLQKELRKMLPSERFVEEEDELDLNSKDFHQLREDWKDQDFV